MITDYWLVATGEQCGRIFISVKSEPVPVRSQELPPSGQLSGHRPPKHHNSRD